MSHQTLQLRLQIYFRFIKGERLAALMKWAGFPQTLQQAAFFPITKGLCCVGRERQAKRQCRWGWGWGIKSFLAFLEQHCHQEENVTKPQAMWANKRRLFSCSIVSDSLQSHGLWHTRFPLSFTISWSLLKLMSIVSMIPSNHLILCCPLLLLPSIFLQYEKERNALVEQKIQKSWMIDSEAKLKMIPVICRWDNLNINKVAMDWNTWNTNLGFCFVLFCFFPLHHVVSGICFSTRGTCGPCSDSIES